MKTVLVIEDDPTVRESLQDLLEVQGFRAITAASGNSGIQLAAEQVPDVILCDVQMPGMDGYEVLTSLQQNIVTTTIPFIFLTAKGMRHELRRGMNLGADDYLTKPCTSHDLLSAISTRLEKSAIQQSQSQAQLDNLRSTISLSLPHELRTPLTGIITSAELLRTVADSATPSDIMEIADTIQASSQKLYRLIQNFLYYAQLEIALRDPEQRAAFSKGETYQPDMVIMHAATLAASRVDREADLMFDLESAKIAIAHDDLERLITELVSNALKFSSQDSIVKIVSRVEPEHFRVEVSDRGRGMTPDQIQRLGAYIQFERRFYEQQGLGLGLEIAKLLLDIHGGSLTIHSIPNQLTTITAVFPLVKKSK